jgi:hypothetical protein
VRRNYLLWLCLLWQCADYFSALWLVLWCCVVAAYLNLEEGTPPRAGLRSIRCRSQLTTLLVLTALAAVGFAANPSLTLAPTLTLTLT